MYDSYIDNSKYCELEQELEDVVNGDSELDFDELGEAIQEAYDNREISSSQYDELMGIVLEYT